MNEIPPRNKKHYTLQPSVSSPVLYLTKHFNILKRTSLLKQDNRVFENNKKMSTKAVIIDKPKLTRRNLCQVFYSRLQITLIITKQSDLKLKTQPKQLLRSIPIFFAIDKLQLTRQNLCRVFNLTCERVCICHYFHS